ncbi:FAD:protein FMN transferase [Actinomyces sp. 594]|uniref:FAD:protein FMN transferase n=1 Tax=Actinomyces sp. 594 TaxID=2057793 RepID=UPI001C59A631|nr:FAD:protein FMN transferase [Actinomyces sp. 594]MBW3069318.1 FAD:protein FMN transferase [Actinomyces sp. 594]
MRAPSTPSGLVQAWRFEATGCPWKVLTRDRLPDTLRKRITERISAFEDVWSRFRPGSLVRRAAAGALPRRADGGVELSLPPGSGTLLDLYDRLHAVTDGRLDPLAGADLAELGYDAEYSFAVRDGAAHRLGAVHGRATWAGWACHRGDLLVLRGPALIDVGAAGKGFLADLLADWLRDAAYEEYLIDAGGDLLVHCAEPVRIGLELPGAGGHPGAQGRGAAHEAGGSTGEVIGVVELTDGAVCASGVSRRTWGPGLHHILDAYTGLPVAGASAVVATWTVTRSCAEADGLATALFVADPARLAAAGFDYDFALLRADGSAAASRTWRDLPAELFTSPHPGR